MAGVNSIFKSDGKGDWRRRGDNDAYAEAYDRIFGKKEEKNDTQRPEKN